MSISPQGYTLGGNPENINPFWGEDEETNWTIDAEATIDSSTGSPSVDVDTQTDTTLKKKTFIFNFKHLKGTPGTDGTDGTDGVSPTVTTENIQGGVRVTITDETGAHSFDIMNGTDGRNGIDGDDGYSPTVTTQSIDGGVRVTITDEGGDHIFDIMNGTNGTNGVDGVDGVSPTVSTTSITGGTEVTITDKNGSHTFDVMNGTDGTDNIVEVTSVQYAAMEQAGTLDPDVAYFINDADPAPLGTAAFKNYTDTLTPNSTALIESRAVYNAISQTISGIFTPKGNIDFADLTSALLIPANVGNVYETNDAGTTDANWVQGAGVSIPAQSAVAIIQADVIKFNYNGPAVFNLNDYQTKNLTSTTQGAATVEGALSNLASQKAEQSALNTTNSNVSTLQTNANTADVGHIFHLPYYSWADIDPTHDTETFMKKLIDILDARSDVPQSVNTLYWGHENPNSMVMVWGYTYSTALKQYSAFHVLMYGAEYLCGYAGGNWYFKQFTLT